MFSTLTRCWDTPNVRFLPWKTWKDLISSLFPFPDILSLVFNFIFADKSKCLLTCWDIAQILLSGQAKPGGALFHPLLSTELGIKMQTLFLHHRGSHSAPVQPHPALAWNWEPFPGSRCPLCHRVWRPWLGEEREELTYLWQVWIVGLSILGVPGEKGLWPPPNSTHTHTHPSHNPVSLKEFC